MKITVISAWYNEALIAPFFLNHYNDFVDEYYIILDQDTNDNTLDILNNNSVKVNVIPLAYPDGFCDKLKINTMMEVYRQQTEGWCILVDSDEFVYESVIGVRQALIDIESNGYNVISSDMSHPYRNVYDVDLDPLCKPLYQRRHGVKASSCGSNFNKPCVAKSGLDIVWSPGCHLIDYGTYNRCEGSLDGVHWRFADPSLTINRYTKNRVGRNGDNNISMGYGVHYNKFNENYVIEECNKHLYDPIIL